MRVIDAGTRISAPFCAGLLGELGAEVIKVEQPGRGDFMRTIGPFAAPNDDADAPPYSLFWAVEGRGRKGVTCDLRRADGQELFRRLVATADVVCENFRPGTMEAWHVGPADCDERLVWARISVFGQDGPYSKRPGLDRLGIGYGGLLHLTGYPDRPPVRPGVTVSDYLTGAFAAEAAIAALYERDVRGTGRGRVVDAPLYGAILRILEWTVAGHDRLGLVRSREGNRLANSAPLDNYPTADGKYVCIVAGSDANFASVTPWEGPTCSATRAGRRSRSAPIARTRSTGSSPTGRRLIRRRRSRRHASLTTSRSEPRTRPPTSRWIPTWPCAATSSTSTTPCSARCDSRHRSPGSTTSDRTRLPAPPAWASTTTRSGAGWWGSRPRSWHGIAPTA